MTKITVGSRVSLTSYSEGCIVPDGWHTVSQVNEDGSFHVGGKTAIWPDRVKEVRHGTD